MHREGVPQNIQTHTAASGCQFTFSKDHTCCSMENGLQGQSGFWRDREGPRSVFQMRNDGFTQSGGSENEQKI